MAELLGAPLVSPYAIKPQHSHHRRSEHGNSPRGPHHLDKLNKQSTHVGQHARVHTRTHSQQVVAESHRRMRQRSALSVGSMDSVNSDPTHTHTNEHSKRPRKVKLSDAGLHGKYRDVTDEKTSESPSNCAHSARTGAHAPAHVLASAGGLLPGLSLKEKEAKTNV